MKTSDVLQIHAQYWYITSTLVQISRLIKYKFNYAQNQTNLSLIKIVTICKQYNEFTFYVRTCILLFTEFYLAGQDKELSLRVISTNVDKQAVRGCKLFF